MSTSIFKISSVLCCVFFFFVSVVGAQSKIGERILIGTSVTYLSKGRNTNLKNNFNELTWNKNIAINLNRRFYLGISYLNIVTSGVSNGNKNYKDYYTVSGLFLQYDFKDMFLEPHFAGKTKFRGFIELSWNLGNYCVCKNYQPYKEKGLNYLGFAGGFTIPLNKFLSLDLSAGGYNIISGIFKPRIESKYTYFQYVVGLDIDFIKLQK